MKSTTHSQTPPKSTRNRTSVSSLAASVARHIQGNLELETNVPNLTFNSFTGPTQPTNYVLAPSVCLVVQGEKRVLLGADDHSYRVGEFLVTSLDLPLVAQVIQASKASPYLGLRLKLDRKLIAQLLLEHRIDVPASPKGSPAINVSALDQNLLNAFGRLIDLLDDPESIPVLSPLIQKEIFYRLLRSPAGAIIRRISVAGDHTHSIGRVIDSIKQNLSSRLRVEQLAKLAGVSVSTLHLQFRTLTSMSPLQFQKRLRLDEARRLMLTEHMDAASAGFQVGYESPSQFSREYSRAFGNPPLRDIRSLEQVVGSN